MVATLAACVFHAFSVPESLGLKMEQLWTCGVYQPSFSQLKLMLRIRRMKVEGAQVRLSGRVGIHQTFAIVFVAPVLEPTDS